MNVRTGPRTAVAALAVSAGLGAAAAPAGAMSLPPGWSAVEQPGTSIVSVPAGVTGVELSASGGRGGGALGGQGAWVNATIQVRGGQLLTLTVGKNGAAAIDRAPTAGTVLPGDGGGASVVALCDPAPARCVALSARVLVAAGGGGTGGGLTAFSGGAGGSAGAPGSPGAGWLSTAEGAGSGGSAATVAAGGRGGAGGPIPSSCAVGVSGLDGAAGLVVFGGGSGGGLGVAGYAPARIGGGGGGGYRGGGGGGSAALCAGDQAGGGGGGGGGASLVPGGGTSGLADSSFTAPGIRYRFVNETTAPIVTVTTPADGATYAHGSVVNAVYACSDEAGGSGVAVCDGSVANGTAIGTGVAGRKLFTVKARDAAGNETVKTVTYLVSPVVTGLRGSAKAIGLRLSDTARVTVRVERRLAGRKARWKLAVKRTTQVRAGAGSVALGRRPLPAGRYRVTVTASAGGVASRPAAAAFAVKAQKSRR